MRMEEEQVSGSVQSSNHSGFTRQVASDNIYPLEYIVGTNFLPVTKHLLISLSNQETGDKDLS